MTEEQEELKLKSKIWPVISTETLYRKWERRLIVAKTTEEIEKCKYHMLLNQIKD